MKLSVKRLVTNVIVCDVIREEVGNKQSLMGVYSGDIVFSDRAKPNVLVCVYLLFSVPSGTDFELNFRVRVDRNIVAAAKVPISNNDLEGNGAVNISGVPISVTKDGYLYVEAAIDSGPFFSLMKKRVRLPI